LLDVHFVLLGALCSVLGQIVYLRDTLRGTTQPNRVTYLLWAAAPLLAFTVEIQSGVGLRALLPLMAGLGPVAVLLASWASRSAAWRITRADLACGALSVLGTVGWWITREGLVAIAAAIAADFLAGVPTVVKSWRYPETETAVAYAGASANAIITLLTVTRFALIEVAFPAYIFMLASTQLAVIGGRLGPRWRARRATRAATSAAG
jgi:hypothetical protein